MSIKNSTAVDRFESNQPNESIAKTTFADWCVLNEVNPAEVSELVDSNDKAAFYDTAFRLGTRNFLNSFIAQTSRQMPDLNALSSELKNMRMYGDSEEVGVQERETAQLFQRIISSYVYNKATSHPKDILDTQQMNCVGASHIGGALLEAVGIRVLQASGGSHCFLIMVTSDNRVWWQDMQDGKEIPELFNQELTDEKITGSLDGWCLFKCSCYC